MADDSDETVRWFNVHVLKLLRGVLTANEEEELESVGFFDLVDVYFSTTIDYDESKRVVSGMSDEEFEEEVERFM